MIRYSIFPVNPAAHLFEVTLNLAKPNPAGQRFVLPTWIPGSYMIREFARHVVALAATADGQPLACAKVDKCTWQCAPTQHALTLTYTVYAWDLSVRGAHLDETHGFFNGVCVFMLPEGFRDAPCEVEIKPPLGERYAKWQIASALSAKNASKRPPAKDFGFFKAANYDELIDHPVEMGTFAHATFDACGVPHHVVLTGRHRADMPRLCADLQKICEAQIRLFEPQTAQAPMGEYWFLLMAVGEGFGGLEHRASTALIVGRDELPLANEPRVTAGYRKLLSLASHEYFHTWNVKRILPAAFAPYDLAHENYTQQLWFFEGFTDYYDDLMLTRAGVITALEYLEMEADNIGRVLSQAGRHKQSVAESSFDAWVKYYRQDENSVNSMVSYYQKGALVGLALDLTIREQTGNTKSLDDVMRALWTRFGRPGIGVAPGEIERVANDVAGVDLTTFFANAVYGTEDLDLGALLATAGITLSWRGAVVGANTTTATSTKAAERIGASLNAKIGSDNNGDARLAHVFDGGAAMSAGLSAGDTIVAVDGLRVNAANLERRLKSYDVGSTIDVVAFRRDELMLCRVQLQASMSPTCVLTLNEAPAEAKARRLSWLGG